MVITYLSATKPTPSSPIGITFASGEGALKLCAVNDNSIFVGTGLTAGMRIATINGTSTLGMNTSEVKAVLASISSEVVLGIDMPQYVGLTLPATDKSMPSLFAAQHVPTKHWNRICNTLQKELHPTIEKCMALLNRYKDKMSTYASAQMIKGSLIGFGTESSQEKKMILMTHQSAIAAQNVTLAASSVLALANALLNSRGIVAELYTTEHRLPSTGPDPNFLILPKGLKFSLIDPSENASTSPDEC